MLFAGVLFDCGWSAALLVPGCLLLDDSGGPPPVSDGCDGVRYWPRLPTLVPAGGLRSPGIRRDPDDGLGALQGRESLRERRAVRKLYLMQKIRAITHERLLTCEVD